uniref:Mitochondrial GTPase 1 n=1 Tax=Bionectria ochroleuca TaxID=29856 RepID=A0A0B7KFP2_BIOOC
MARFIPRDAFGIPNSIPKTYFLGHHQAGANKIKTVLPTISLVLECRDFRLPLSTHNPYLERSLAGRERLVVYTKSDLGSDSRGAKNALKRGRLLGQEQEVHHGRPHPTAQGVALAHGIKKGLIQDEILVDYLLYRMNLFDPEMYGRYCEPTNDVNDFLAAVATKEGRLRPGGIPNIPEAAARVLSQWRDGRMGRFVLDDLSEDAIRAHEIMLAEPRLSINQAKKLQKEERKKEKSSE